MSEPTAVFVLFGQTGEYSDHSEWVVRAYTTKEAADADCAALNGMVAGADRMEYEQREAVVARLKQHDADATIDYTGTDYFVGKVPLVDAPQIPPAALPLSEIPTHE